MNDEHENEIDQAEKNLIAEAVGAVEDIPDPLDGLVEKSAADPGAAFTPEILELLAALKKEDRAAFDLDHARPLIHARARRSHAANGDPATATGEDPAASADFSSSARPTMPTGMNPVGPAADGNAPGCKRTTDDPMPAAAEDPARAAFRQLKTWLAFKP